MAHYTLPQRGFSLVELSIVLVILGLLTGGILTGQNLIRAAELRSVSTEFQAYQTAVMTFRDKYFALPGDMPNATNFWGAMTNCGGASPSGSGTETCSGDGDGVLDFPAAASQTGELFNFWQHLANAGLIEGSYSGISGTGSSSDAEIGENTPASKISNAGWSTYYTEFSGSGTYNFQIEGGYLNTLEFGVNSPGYGTNDTALTPEEAWNIDTKIDDGMPAQGKIIARYWDDLCAAAASNTDISANYKLSDSSIQCALFFIRAF